MDKRGIEATTDAIVFLALMLVGTGAIYGLASPVGHGISTEQMLADEAGWGLSALTPCNINQFETVESALAEGKMLENTTIESMMEQILPPGRGWELIWTNGNITTTWGLPGTGTIGGSTICIGDGLLCLKIYNK